MEISLQKAVINDCEEIHRMQIISFEQLLHKYNDINTNPGAESLDKIRARLNQEETDYYLIRYNQKKIGAIRVVRLQDEFCRISLMFLLPEYQGKGFAQQAILAVESLYAYACGWQLDTIQEEEKLCHLYEKMGYRKTGEEKVIQKGMTIVYYAK